MRGSIPAVTTVYPGTLTNFLIPCPRTRKRGQFPTPGTSNYLACMCNKKVAILVAVQWQTDVLSRTLCFSRVYLYIEKSIYAMS